MRARARVVAMGDGSGGTRLVELVQAAPIGLRPTRDALMLVSSAQGLLSDDDLELELIVGPGANLVVRSAAATIAYSSTGARMTVSCSVASAGTLDWHPEPLIVTAACDVSVLAAVALEPGSRVRWTEECVLGRSGEGPGRTVTSLVVDCGTTPVLRHQLVCGSAAPGWDGPAVLGEHRAVGFSFTFGDDSPPQPGAGEGWAVMTPQAGGALISAVGADLIELRSRVTEAGGPTRLVPTGTR